MFIRKNIRLQKVEYSKQNFYFITICEKFRRVYFSEIENMSSKNNTPKIKLKLKPIGVVIDLILTNINDIFSGVKLHKYVIMPNHVHFILEVNIENIVYKNSGKIARFNQIITAIKSKSIFVCEQNGLELSWQRSFYERIVRNEKEFEKISTYILNNPIQWNLDKLNPEFNNSLNDNNGS
ncbi:MAG: transposase [bacterium]